MSGNTVFHTLLRMNVVKQIVIGLLLGIALYIVSPQAAMAVQILGKMFVGALQAIAPFLVFVLVTAAITKHQKGNETQIKPILLLYLIGTLGAALVAVAAGLAFPTTLALGSAKEGFNPPQGIVEILHTLMMKLVDNPVSALAGGNYIGILAWSLLLGFAPLSPTPPTPCPPSSAGSSASPRWASSASLPPPWPKPASARSWAI